MTIKPQRLWFIILLNLMVMRGRAEPNPPSASAPQALEAPEPTRQAAHLQAPNESKTSTQRAGSEVKRAQGSGSKPKLSGAQRARALSFKILNADDARVRQSALKRRQSARERLRAFPLTQPLPLRELRTTSCPLFLSNFDHKLNALKTRYQERPQAPQVAAGYAAQLYARGQLFGDLDEIAQALALVETTIQVAPQAFKLRLLRAQIAATLHKVEITARDLKWARAQFKDPPRPPAELLERLDAMREELDLERGTQVQEHITQMTRGYRALNFKGYIRAARARELLGQVALAQRYYGQAERHFTDVAPIPLAWLNVQRGLMAMHSGDFKGAHAFFQAGYDRCPQYPMAAEHLAEIEGRLGHFERSVELYQAVIKQTNNPEFMAALAELYLERSMESEAQALIARARVRFDDLASRYPEAMSGHAADFYLGIGKDPARGVALLRRNYQLRPNAQAAQALAAALIDTGALKEAKPLVARSLESPVEFAEKYWTAARLAASSGRREVALKHRARALKLNPRIAEFEGPLEIAQDHAE